MDKIILWIRRQSNKLKKNYVKRKYVIKRKTIVVNKMTKIPSRTRLYRIPPVYHHLIQEVPIQVMASVVLVVVILEAVERVEVGKIY